MILGRTAVCMAVDRLDAVLVPHNAAPTEYTTVIRNYFIFRSTDYVQLSGKCRPICVPRENSHVEQQHVDMHTKITERHTYVSVHEGPRYCWSQRHFAFDSVAYRR